MKQEIKDKIVSFLEESGATKVEISTGWDGKTLNIKFEKDGESLGSLISFKVMKGVSDLVGTEEINIEDEYSSGGCESCGWGAKTTATYVCYNVKDL